MKPNKQSPDKAVPQTTKLLKLRKNHGTTRNGRICAFYEAGSQFDPIDDAELIATLVQSGAQLDE